MDDHDGQSGPEPGAEPETGTQAAEPASAPDTPDAHVAADSDATPGAGEPGSDETAHEPADDESDSPRDLIVGLVGAVGTDLPWVEHELLGHLGSLGFDAQAFSLSGLMDREYGGALPARGSVPYDDYVFEHMTAGNVLRALWRSADALALVAVEDIRRRRDARPDMDRRPFAVVLRSLKRPEEIRLLREVYRGQFVVVGCHTPRDTRIRQLSDAIARTRGAGTATAHRARAEELADRDEHELGPPSADPAKRAWLKENGQSVEEAFPLADAYINLQDRARAARELRRFCDLLLGSPFVSPSKDEHAMFHAGSAAVRSADMSRQVVGAIAKDGRVIAVGCNEVPRAGGGTYWEGDSDDARDFRLGMDGNQDQRDRALREVFEVLSARGLLTQEALDAGLEVFAKTLNDTRVDGLIEFTRAAHAEMVALLDAAQRGVGVDGAVLYTSTFPCHNCAKHIIAAGISRVVFIEPYPKSLAEQLHGDAIAFDDPRRTGPTVHFEHFAGVAPVNYFTLFKSTGKRNNDDGTPKDFSITSASPKLRGSFHHTPLVYEEQVIETLRSLREDYGSPTVDMLPDAPSAREDEDPSSQPITVRSEGTSPIDEKD
jgi:deoxycytidylate deaminase